MLIENVFAKKLASQTQEVLTLREKKKELAPFFTQRRKHKRQLKNEIADLKTKISNGRISNKQRAEYNERLSFLHAIYEREYGKPARKRLDVKVVKDEKANAALNRMMEEHFEITGKWQNIKDRVVKRFQLTVLQEAMLGALYLMWQPHQETSHPVYVLDHISRVLFELKKRKSPASQEMKKTIRNRPLYKQFMSRTEAANEPNSEEILARGEPFWRLIPYRTEYAITAKEMLAAFEKVRPFFSDELALKVANELADLLIRHGLKEIPFLTAFYNDIVWYNNLPMQMKGYRDYKTFERELRHGDLGGVVRSDLIDFTVLKLDELFKEIGLRRGKDAWVSRLANAMSGKRNVFRRREDVATRRRDLMKKPRWRRYCKMREDGQAVSV